MARKLFMPPLASVPRIAAAAIAAAAVFYLLELARKPAGEVQNPPELDAKHHALFLTLHAGITKGGKDSFYFDGRPNAPTMRLSPGDQLKISYKNVPYGGSVDVIMDFTDRAIRGMSVFHCHLLNHEDKGMMAKVLFE